MSNRFLIGVTRRYRVTTVVSVVVKDADTNRSISDDIRSNMYDLKDGPGGPMIVENVEDVEYIPDLGERRSSR